MLLKISEIKISEGRRAVEPGDVQALADSIREVGLMNPVTVTANHTLVAGLHRLEAAKRLGWENIECTVIEADDLHAELAEIDENYVRANLTPLESSKIMLRRKEIYETLHPETKAGAAQGEGMKRAASEDSGDDLADNLSVRSPAKPFAEDTADKLGVDPRTVRRQVQIAKDLAPEVQEMIEQSAKKFTQQDLIKLSRMEPNQQQEAAAWMIEGKVRSVDGYQEKKKWADVAAGAETVVVQDPNLPFKTETKRFHSIEESIADMKTEKTCCDSPDMFMSDITHYIDQFCRGLDVYYHPQYASVYPSITKEQFDFLQGRANVIHEAVDAMLDFIQHPENNTSKQENENE